MTRDILAIGDVWAHDISPLELQNTDSKRTVELAGSKHLTTSDTGLTHRKDKEGVVQSYATKGYSGTAALSTLRKTLGLRKLRENEGPDALRPSRRAERLFGEKAVGRVTRPKLELVHAEAVERQSCVHAFADMIRARKSSPDPP